MKPHILRRILEAVPDDGAWHTPPEISTITGIDPDVIRRYLKAVNFVVNQVKANRIIIEERPSHKNVRVYVRKLEVKIK